MTTALAELFRRNVKQLMAEDGWTQQDLADEMGVTQGFVSQMLRGYRTPGLDVIQRFADALGVEATDLLTPQVHA